MEETYVCNAITEAKVVMNETVVISKEPVLNETMVIDKKPNLNNETVVLSKKDEELEIAMSDDDGHTPTKAQPVMKKKATVKKAGKAIFNPYESSPVKSRVEAFEKIATEQATAARVTRSKKNTVKNICFTIVFDKCTILTNSYLYIPSIYLSLL